MCLSIFLALVIGFYLFFVSLAMLVQQQRFKKVVHDLLAQPFLTLSGSCGILFGLLIVVCHNQWVSNWPVLITLIGWFTLLQGIAKIFIPDQFVKWVKDCEVKLGCSLIAWFWLLIGVYLVWAGMQ